MQLPNKISRNFVGQSKSIDPVLEKSIPSKYKKLFLPSLMGFSLLLSACGSTSSASSTSTTSKNISTASLAKASSSTPLVIYAAEGYDKAEGAAFQKATGIKTEVVDRSTGPLLAKIQAEKNNPQWGLLWVDGAEAFAALDTQHMLVRGFEPQGSLNKLGQVVVPKDKSYVPTGLTVAGAVVYNVKTLPTPPTNWNQLLTPSYKGAVGMNNPAVSGPTYPFVAGMMKYQGGEKKGKTYFEKLKANGLQIFRTNKVTLHALESGQLKVAIVQNSAGLGASFKDPNLKVAYPSKVTVLPSVIGIDAHASKIQQAEAERFAQFVYSTQGQKVMLSGDPHGDSLFYPIRKGISPHKVLPSLASVPTQATNPYKWGPRESSIDNWFSNNIVQ